MATNFSGDLSLSGTIRSGLGVSFPVTGRFHLSFDFALDPTGGGKVTGRTYGTGGFFNYSSGSVQGAYNGVRGYSPVNTGFGLYRASFPISDNTFSISQTVPFGGDGVYLALKVTGVIGGTIVTNITGTLFGAEEGVSFTGNLIGGGSITGTPIVAYGLPSSYQTRVIGSTTPYAQTKVLDLDTGVPITATVSLGSAAAGTLSDPVGGSFDPARGVFSVSGSEAQVTAALNAMTFTPGDQLGPANAGIRTEVTLALSDGAGGSAPASQLNLFWTEPGISALSTIDPAFLPYGQLTADAAGNLFSTATINGVRGVFELPRSGDGYGAPREVATIPGGLQPGLAVDPLGNILAVTSDGGTLGLGAIWEIPRVGGGFGAAQKLSDVYNTAAARPVGSLILDAEGNVYGGADVPGFAAGAIFELKRTETGFAATTDILSMFSFGIFAGDGVPNGPLYRDAEGNLFATAAVNMGNITGLVYELPYTDGTYTSTPSIVAVMDWAIGAGSISAVTADSHGNLFGTAQGGGGNSNGSVFEVVNSATGYAASATEIASFGASDPLLAIYQRFLESPYSGVIVDGAGNLFGTAQGNMGSSMFELPYQGGLYPSIPVDIADIQDPAHSLADGEGRLLTTAGGYGYSNVVALAGSGYVAPAPGGAVTLAGANGALLSFPFADPTAPRAVADMLEAWVLAGAAVPLAHATDAPPPGVAGLLVVGGAGAVTVPAGFIGAAITAGAVTVAGGAANGQMVFAGSGGIAFDAGLGSGSIFAAGGDNLFSVHEGAGSQRIQAGAGNDTVVLLAGDDTVDAGAGRNLILTGAGQDVVVSNGDDLIAAGAIGTATITAGANNPTVFLGPGINRFEGGSGHATVVATAGTDSIASQGGSQIWLGSGQAVVTSGGSDTIIGGSGAASISAAGDGLIFAGAGALDITAGAGSTTVLGNPSGALTLRGGGGAMVAIGYGGTMFLGGSGSATVAAFGGSLHAVGGVGDGLFLGGPAGGNTISGGGGRSTLLGGGDGDVLTAGRGAGDVIVAGSGAETISAPGTPGAHLIYGGSGADLITLGSGPTNLLAGSGAATIVAGTGQAVIAVANGGHAALTLQNFVPSQDYLSLLGYPQSEATAALGAAQFTGGGELLTLSDGTTILLAGFSGLGAGNFL